MKIITHPEIKTVYQCNHKEQGTQNVPVHFARNVDHCVAKNWINKECAEYCTAYTEGRGIKIKQITLLCARGAGR